MEVAVAVSCKLIWAAIISLRQFLNADGNVSFYLILI